MKMQVSQRALKASSLRGSGLIITVRFEKATIKSLRGA